MDSQFVEQLLAGQDKIVLGQEKIASGQDKLINLMERMLVNQEKPSVGFSKVTGEAAESFLSTFDLTMVDGNELYPVPGMAEIVRFPYFNYTDEEKGNADFLQYHKLHLSLLGLPFGRDGWKMYDFHRNKHMYAFEVGGITYSGNVDGGIAAYGLTEESAKSRLRVAFEHKQDPDDRSAANNLPDVPGETMSFSGRFKGQALAQTIGTYKVCDFPLDVVLTNSKSYIILRLRGQELIKWEGLHAAQAYYLIQDSLSVLPAQRHGLEKEARDLVGLEEPLKKIQKFFQKDTLMFEQLQSVREDPEEVQDVMSAWANHVRHFELPPEIQAFYS
jgi:hypothetical protein